MAAIRLAEVRGEVADLLAQGLGAFTPRAVEAPAARLRELGVARPADLLAGIAARPVEDRLEDVVRVHQVLGVALVRLLGAQPVALDDLEAVPTHPSVKVPRPARWLALDEAMAAAARGELDRWSAAAHLARAIDAVPAAELLARVDPWWSIAALAPMVAARVAALDGAAEVARQVLTPARQAGRVARRTAVRVLVATEAALARAVAAAIGSDGDLGLRSFALACMDEARARGGAGGRAGDAGGAAGGTRAADGGDVEAAAARLRQRRAMVGDLARTLAQASGPDDRRRAAAALADAGDDAATAVLRRAWLQDSSGEVREAAAMALGRLGDAEAIDSFVAALRRRDVDGGAARAAALGLGQSGDVAGAAALVEALVAGWRPPLVAECLRLAGAPGARRLLAAIERAPAVAKRKSTREILGAMSAGDIEALVAERLAERGSGGGGGSGDDAAADDDARGARGGAPDRDRQDGPAAYGCARAVIAALGDEPSGKAAKAAVKRAKAILG
ncbi:MAG: HEAT repeat domain-containing protein [Kofleriaceae bacterium]|nr:HEAT repeat domain-containing protein [Kofleriaceae bacterium]